MRKGLFITLEGLSIGLAIIPRSCFSRPIWNRKAMKSCILSNPEGLLWAAASASSC